MNICGQFLHRIHPKAQKSRRYFKMSFTPFSKLWLLLRRFSLKSQLFNEILCQTSVPNLPKSVTKRGNHGQKFICSRRKVWLSLSRFLRNACLVDNFLQRILTPNFMRILQTVYSLMFGERQTDGRMWSLQRTTQTDFYNNDAFCLLCGKEWIFSFCMFDRAIVQAVSRRPLPQRPRFHPSSDYVRFVVDQVAMAQVFLRVLWLPLSV
jgi:hypothetical protein